MKHPRAVDDQLLPRSVDDRRSEPTGGERRKSLTVGPPAGDEVANQPRGDGRERQPEMAMAERVEPAGPTRPGAAGQQAAETRHRRQPARKTVKLFARRSRFFGDRLAGDRRPPINAPPACRRGLFLRLTARNNQTAGKFSNRRTPRCPADLGAGHRSRQRWVVAQQSDSKKNFRLGIRVKNGKDSSFRMTYFRKPSSFRSDNWNFYPNPPVTPLIVA